MTTTFTKGISPLSYHKDNRSANTSFSGADIIASITPIGGKPKVFGELQTITYSIHREKFPVRSLGRINPKGFTQAGRTIAGSMIFTVFDRHAMQDAIKKDFLSHYGDMFTGDEAEIRARELITDEMPPFNITISFVNEYGKASRLSIYGITIVDEGQVMSIDDMITENTMSYMARDIDLLAPVDRAGNVIRED